MSGFMWLDSNEQRRELDSCAPIEAELADVERLLKAYADDLESDDQVTWEAALTVTETLVLRRNALLADLQRWNDHVAALNELAADEAVAIIDQLVADAALIRRIHAHYADYVRSLAVATEVGAAGPGDQQAGAQLLALVNDIAARHGGPVPAVATVTDAHAWLCAQPETNRTPLALAYPAFTWRDRHGHTVQVRSLVEIEREQLGLVSEMAVLRPKLTALANAQERATALEHARVTQARLVILEQDVERWVTHVGEVRRRGARDRANEIRRMKP